MPLEPDGRGPYAPTAALTNVIETYRDRGLGTPITLDVLVRAGVSESLAARTSQALRLLELVDEDGNPTPHFKAMRQARGDDEFQALLQEWVRAEYADILQYADPTQHDQDRVAEAFRGYRPAGQRMRMATLLLGLWQYAGLPLAEASKEPRPRPPRPRTPRPVKRTAPPKNPYYGGGDAGLPPLGLPSGLVGLLQQIPQGGASWTSKRREEFLGAFKAVLDFSVPVDDSTKKKGDEPVITGDNGA